MPTSSSAPSAMSRVGRRRCRSPPATSSSGGTACRYCRPTGRPRAASPRSSATRTPSPGGAARARSAGCPPTARCASSTSRAGICPPADDGEILGRPDRAAGARYLTSSGQEPLPVDADGWYHTGDVGHLDEHGILYITGRLKEMMIVGGFNVYPAEVEDALRASRLVQDAVVVPVPDDRLGEVPIAGIVWSDPADAEATFSRLERRVPPAAGGLQGAAAVVRPRPAAADAQRQARPAAGRRARVGRHRHRLISPADGCRSDRVCIRCCKSGVGSPRSQRRVHIRSAERRSTRGDRRRSRPAGRPAPRSGRPAPRPDHAGGPRRRPR